MNKRNQRISATRRWRTIKLGTACAALLLSVDVITTAADDKQWIGTWATAAQPFLPKSLQTYRNQSLRLIVHTSIGGTRVRIKISNTYGDGPLLIGGAHIARRTAAAEIDPRSDRILARRVHDLY